MSKVVNRSKGVATIAIIKYVDLGVLSYFYDVTFDSCIHRLLVRGLTVVNII